MGLTDYLIKIGEKIGEEMEKVEQAIEEEIKGLNKTLDEVKTLRKEEKQKMKDLGLEAYVKDVKENKSVYGDVSEEHVNKLQGYHAEAEKLGKDHFSKDVVEECIYSLGVHYRRKMLKKDKTKTMEEK